jgi:hypothetical protein
MGDSSHRGGAYVAATDLDAAALPGAQMLAKEHIDGGSAFSFSDPQDVAPFEIVDDGEYFRPFL